MWRTVLSARRTRLSKYSFSFSHEILSSQRSGEKANRSPSWFFYTSSVGPILIFFSNVTTLCLPADLADLPLVKFDVSCNKVSTIPVCYRNMKQLQSLQLENNPLQSPPAQVRPPICTTVIYKAEASVVLQVSQWSLNVCQFF